MIPFADRGASAQQLLSNSMLFGEFTYRLPGGRRRRARRTGPPTLFHAVPTRQLHTMVWRLLLSQTPITIRPTNRCRTGWTPGCANTSGVVI